MVRNVIFLVVSFLFSGCLFQPPPEYYYYKPIENRGFVKNVKKEGEIFQLENELSHLTHSYYSVDVADKDIEAFMFMYTTYVPRISHLKFRAILKNVTENSVLIDSIEVYLKDEDRILELNNEIVIKPKSYEDIHFEYRFEDQPKYYLPGKAIDIVLYKGDVRSIIPFYFDKQHSFNDLVNPN